MKSLLGNIKDRLKKGRDWLTVIKFYIITKFMSQEEKNNVLIQAKNQAEDILRKNRLNIPFKEYLKNRKDLKRYAKNNKYTNNIGFRTEALYEKGSAEKGMVKIFINSDLIGKDIDRVVFNILHEHSHGIYEEGFTRNFGLEILKLIDYVNPSLQRKREGIVSDFNEHEHKEYFCDWFASYLKDEKKIIDNENKEKIKKICENIIRKYVQK